MNFKIPDRKKKMIKRLYKIALVLIGLIVVIFNDTFGKLDGFVEFIALYFIIIFITIARWLFKQIKFIIRLKNEKSKTELMHLKSQVNPHFFFNMLNNLYGLVDKDSKKAQELILKLSDMMRYSIYDGEKDTVLLSEEITYLENYIELHKMRYHKVIDVQFNIETNDNDYEIMPLLFIILLENAFKHGVENLRENAYVHINLVAHNNEVIFEIENNFDVTEDKEESGIGLKNLKRRLELVYPKNHMLTKSKTDNIYSAKLNINGL
ncbi:sensor histidine kinase [Winogradskyella immobilis]|uniref:Histidine kinase n=1 Tax=Winogradskyella immobilis TaxID=2816852 RepID=A0ABS8EN40_9FLAO|nr:histidine kinase [Winogradskyella immobilis]MCC1484644.1 histidine kinase [Winogradskyella immobilis]MCG0016736.1 histidine kinase [Winogradskyella immobilis]